MNILRYVMTIVHFCVRLHLQCVRINAYIADFKITLCVLQIEILFIKDVHDRVFLVVEKKIAMCI